MQSKMGLRILRRHPLKSLHGTTSKFGATSESGNSPLIFPFPTLGTRPRVPSLQLISSP